MVGVHSKDKGQLVLEEFTPVELGILRTMVVKWSGTKSILSTSRPSGKSNTGEKSAPTWQGCREAVPSGESRVSEQKAYKRI